MSSSCHKSAKVRLVATCRLQPCYNLLKQLSIAASLLTTCNRPVVIKGMEWYGVNDVWYSIALRMFIMVLASQLSFLFNRNPELPVPLLL